MKILAIILGVIVSTSAFASSLPNGTLLSITQGTGASGTAPCSVGSCISFNNGGLIWVNFGPGTDGGIILGTDQATGGQEFDGSITDSGGITSSWVFFNSRGCFGTAPMCAPDTSTIGCAITDSSSNIFSPMSCTTTADCVDKTILGTLNWGWNGVAIPLGNALGCSSIPSSNCVGVESWIVNPNPATQVSNSSYELRYKWAVPFGDPSGFGNVPIGLILRGNITFPGCHSSNDCPLNYACNINDGSCYASNLCAGVTCIISDQCHTIGICDPATGLCNNPIKFNGSACSDGNGCTISDTCQNGVCISGSQTVCNPPVCKTNGVCNTSTGSCSYSNQADNTGCGSGKICTNGTCGPKIGSMACWKVNTGAIPTGWCSDSACTICN